MRKNDSCIAVFGGQRFRAEKGSFFGAKLLAVFGGVNCDLTEISVAQGSTVYAIAIFGGIDIRVPENINVKVRSFSLFGGTSDRRETPNDENAPVLYIKSFNLFGGTDIL